MLKSKKATTYPAKCGAKEVATMYAETVGCSKKDADEAVRHTINCIGELLKNGSSVSFVGFGSFEVKNRAAREGINPKTKEHIQIAESKCVKFKAGKTLKDEING